ncbi:hypothetical protein H2O04_22315 [Pseudomonas aeruginosa]|nr:MULTISPECIES: hypothetical protein [Pseudomonas]MBA5027585.1 hypothetical protein [Pseudomonas aeruginosa]MBA5132139.1 hypothetical protein [Pseudomonas aeruginosa]MBG6979256.1 hypothetical protein [Pseudomonas aeruginosa]NTT16860.1 hypothetical protein [Pseudomonas aeruginosa]
MLRAIPFRAPFKLALTFVFLTTPLFAHAGGTAAAAAIASAAAAAHSDKEPLVAGQSFGATGYLFVDGVGYSGGRMVYCPASVGFVKPEDMFRSKNKITKGVCQSIDVVQVSFLKRSMVRRHTLQSRPLIQRAAR